MVDQLIAMLWMLLTSSQLSATLHAARGVAASVNAAYTASSQSMLNWFIMFAMATSVPQVSTVTPATAPNVAIALLVMVVTAGSLVLATRSRALKVMSVLVMVIGSLCALAVLPEILPPVLLIPRPPTVRTVLYSVNLYLRTLHVAYANATGSGLVHGSSDWASIVPDTIDWSRLSFKTRFVALTRAGMLVDLSGARHTEVVKIWHVGPWCSFQELLCVASHAIRCFVVAQSKKFGLSLSNVPCAGINGSQWINPSETLVSTISVIAIAGFVFVSIYKLVNRFFVRSSSNLSVTIDNGSLVKACAQSTSTITPAEQLASLSADHHNLVIHLAHSALTIADLQWRLDQAERELKEAKSENVFWSTAICGAPRSTPVISRYVNRSRLVSIPLNKRSKTRSKSLPTTPVLSSTSSFGPRTLTPSSSVLGAQLQAASTPTPIKRVRAAYRAHVASNVRRLISRRLAKSVQDARSFGSSSSISSSISSSTSESFETSGPPSPTPDRDNRVDHDVRVQAGINMRNVLLARVAGHREAVEAATPLPSPSPSRSLPFSETVSKQLSGDLGNDVVQVIEAPIPQPVNSSAQTTTSGVTSSKSAQRRRKARSSSSKLLQNRRTFDDVMSSIKAEHTRMWSRDGGTAETADTVTAVGPSAAHGRIPRSRLASRLPATPAPIRIPSASISSLTSSSASASSSRSSSTPTSARSSSTSASSIDSSRWQHDKFSSPSPSPLRTGTARTMLAKSLRKALSGGDARRSRASEDRVLWSHQTSLSTE
ncbi:hypothetical protein BD410DRAFT_369833 [Rickenella mellea]|uniref:Transmembrane protein n=1 Tax=Rickenella mellea TaxID=50990 RepID=A0A4Y7PYD0_9AGAM|nr:hypothetical protein BD410DRAFT_369833 [Rickenella mellea]